MYLVVPMFIYFCCTVHTSTTSLFFNCLFLINYPIITPFEFHLHGFLCMPKFYQKLLGHWFFGVFPIYGSKLKTELKTNFSFNFLAVLAAGAPHMAPFMADECLLAMPDVEGLDYTMREYMRFVDYVKACVERLNSQGKHRCQRSRSVLGNCAVFTK